MRKFISGLSKTVQPAEMGGLMEPHLFVFSGRRRSTIKILYYDYLIGYLKDGRINLMFADSEDSAKASAEFCLSMFPAKS